MRTQTTRTIGGRVGADGSIFGGSGFTVVKVTTGQWDLSFPADFRLISVVATDASGGGNRVYSQNALSKGTVRVYAYTGNTAAATDGNFNFTAVGLGA